LFNCGRKTKFVEIVLFFELMNNLFEIVNSLESKLSKLLSQYTILQEENIKLLQQKNNCEQQLKKQHQLINDLENKYKSLKVANAIVGSKEDKHLTKLKINTLIREIDKCIIQLSD
jgi:cell shape-determining protein MreC